MNLADQARGDGKKGAPIRQKKGQEMDTMPYFLTAQFKEVLEQSEKQKLQIESQASLNKPKAAGTGMYKSEFLSRKVVQQNEKRKTDRLAIKANRQAGQAQTGGGGGRETKGGGKKVAPPSETEESLMQIIEELRNDLQIRDQEYTEQREYLEKIEAQNEMLKKQLLEERQSRATVESKLNKIVNLKELDANFALIENNTYFESKNNKIQSLNSNLQGSVQEQYKTSLANSYVAKYAHRWLAKTREAKERRENEAFYKF